MTKHYASQANHLEHTYRSLRRWLLDYIRGLACPDEDCRHHFGLKQRHTFRVVTEIETIGQALQICAYEAGIARIIALLHDVGRFEQYLTYRTYFDNISLDHGTHGLHVIESKGLLRDFSPPEQHLIQQAIYLHNKQQLPQDLPEDILFFARLIRDADKLDIYRVILKHGMLGKGKDDEVPRDAAPEVSAPIYAELIQGKTIDYSQVKNQTDRILARIGWLFDINFVPTFRLFADRDYFNTLAAALPSTPKVAQILAKAHAHLIQQCALHN